VLRPGPRHARTSQRVRPTRRRAPRRGTEVLQGPQCPAHGAGGHLGGGDQQQPGGTVRPTRGREAAVGRPDRSCLRSSHGWAGSGPVVGIPPQLEPPGPRAGGNLDVRLTRPGLGPVLPLDPLTGGQGLDLRYGGPSGPRRRARGSGDLDRHGGGPALRPVVSLDAVTGSGDEKGSAMARTPGADVRPARAGARGFRQIGGSIQARLTRARTGASTPDALPPGLATSDPRAHGRERPSAGVYRIGTSGPRTHGREDRHGAADHAGGQSLLRRQRLRRTACPPQLWGRDPRLRPSGRRRRRVLSSEDPCP
jgi:hypothetical protein